MGPLDRLARPRNSFDASCQALAVSEGDVWGLGITAGECESGRVRAVAQGNAPWEAGPVVTPLHSGELELFLSSLSDCDLHTVTLTS